MDRSHDVLRRLSLLVRDSFMKYSGAKKKRRRLRGGGKGG